MTRPLVIRPSVGSAQLPTPVQTSHEHTALRIRCSQLIIYATTTVSLLIAPVTIHGQSRPKVAEMLERVYSDTHPLIRSGEFKRRYVGTNLESAVQKPDIEGVSTHIWLPEGYVADKQYPLILYLKWPNVPKPVHSLFDRYGVVFAAVLSTNTQIGSSDWVQKNAQLALNAAHNIAQEFSIDQERIYVGGVSGGAASAINVAPLFPEVFRGGLFFASGGDLDFNDLEIPSLETAKMSGRYFFATGDKDRSQAELLDQYRVFEASGFKNLFLINEPEIGHDTPPAAYFENGWKFLQGDGPGSPPGIAGTSSWWPLW